MFWASGDGWIPPPTFMCSEEERAGDHNRCFVAHLPVPAPHSDPAMRMNWRMALDGGGWRVLCLMLVCPLAIDFGAAQRGGGAGSTTGWLVDSKFGGEKGRSKVAACTPPLPLPPLTMVRKERTDGRLVACCATSKFTKFGCFCAWRMEIE